MDLFIDLFIDFLIRYETCGGARFASSRKSSGGNKSGKSCGKCAVAQAVARRRSGLRKAKTPSVPSDRLVL